MRGVSLSSPSVAYWHLQKLEACGLIGKNAYGEYVVKEKVNITGHVWVGRNLVPRLLCYSLFFLGILGTETAIVTVNLVNGQFPATDLIYLIATNAIAMALFLGEGLLLRKKTKHETSPKQEGKLSVKCKEDVAREEFDEDRDQIQDFFEACSALSFFQAKGTTVCYLREDGIFHGFAPLSARSLMK